ncbi:transposase [Leptospira stimsonii]|uniref:transposase n=1 Tax=Leptospira stimsonii TaxID=2202203 RepID=UPI003D2BFB63
MGFQIKRILEHPKLSALKKFRWVVERVFAWIHSFRASKTGWELKENDNIAILKNALLFFKN